MEQLKLFNDNDYKALEDESLAYMFKILEHKLGELEDRINAVSTRVNSVDNKTIGMTLLG